MPNKPTPYFKDIGIEHVSVREARENFAPLLASVATTSERVVLTRHGKPWVAIVDVDDLSELVKLDGKKLDAFALAHHESVNDIIKDHVSTQEEVTHIPETADIKCFTDAASEREQTLESQVFELKRQIEELNIEKARLGGMVEVFQNTRKIQPSLKRRLNGGAVHALENPKNQRRGRIRSNVNFASKVRAVGT